MDRGVPERAYSTDKREQAHESLTTATTMYREMNMQFWFRKAEAEMRQLR